MWKPTDHASRPTNPTLWEALVVAFLVVAFYHPFLRFGSILSGGDAANLFWPLKDLVGRSLWLQGVVPLWNPYSFLGAPLVASLQHAVYYPPDWLVFGFLPPHWGMNAGNLLHLVLGGVGAWALLGFGLGCAPVVRIGLGAAFPCLAWFWGHQEHINQLAAAVWLPWQALVCWLWLGRRISSPAWVVAYTGLSATQFLCGHPQEAFYCHLFCVALVLGGLVAARGERPSWGEAVRAGAGAGVLLGLLVAVQLLPTLELNGHSRRQFKDPTYALSFSMPPDLLWTYLNPHHFGSFRDGYFVRGESGMPLQEDDGSPVWDRRAYGEYGLFVGVPLLALALAGVLLEGRRRRLPWGLLAIGAAALLLALGGNTDPRRLLSLQFTEFPEPGGWSLHEVFLRVCPPAQGFRVPARMALLTGFALLVLGALGLESLGRRVAHPGARFGAHALAVLAVLLSLYVPSRREKFHWLVDVSGARAVQESDRRAGWDGAVFRLTMADDGALVRERHRDATFSSGNPILNRALSLQPHLNVPIAQVQVDGYEEGLVPTARTKDFLYAFNRNFRQARPDPMLLSLLGVRWIYSDLPVDAATYPLASERSLPPDRLLYENPFFRGMAFRLAETEGIVFSRLDGPWWQGGSPLPEIQREAVPYGAAPRWGTLGQPLRVERPSTNTLLVRTPDEPALDAVAVLGWYPGWKVVTGRGAEPVQFLSAAHALLPADAAVGGLWRLEFRPESHRTGVFLTALGLGIWAALAGAVIARRRAAPACPGAAGADAGAP